MPQPPRLLLLYGYHDGTTGSLVERGLRARGVEVFAVGPGHAEAPSSFPCGSSTPLAEILERVKERFDPEVILVMESGVKFFPMGLEASPLPCWYFAIDSHFNLSWQVEYAKLFDGVLVAFRQYLEGFRQAGHPTLYWLPHGYDDGFYRDHHLPREIDVAFVGDLDPAKRPQRVALLRALEASGLKCCFTTGIWNQEVARLYSQARLVFNDNDSGVLNPRNFEASACGAVVLANPAHDLEAFFRPGEEILIYREADELVNLARTTLNDPERWQRLSMAAKNAARRNCWSTRVDLLLTALSTPVVPSPFTLAERLKAQAHVYLQRGLPGRTVELTQRLIASGEADGESWLIQALAYLQHGFAQEAAESLHGLLQSDAPAPLLEQLGEILTTTFEQVGHGHGATLTLGRLSTLTPLQQLRLERLIRQEGVS